MFSTDPFELVVGALFASGDDAEVDPRQRCRSNAEHDTRENGAPEPSAHTSSCHLPGQPLEGIMKALPAARVKDGMLTGSSEKTLAEVPTMS